MPAERSAAVTPPSSGTPREWAPRDRLQNLLLRHAQVLISSLGQVWRTPGGSLLTAAVLGIALALPSGLYLLLENARQATAGWPSAPQVSLFLQVDLDPAATRALAQRLAGSETVASVQTITPAEAVAQMDPSSAFRAAVAALEQNPLPAVIVVQPAAGYRAPKALQALAESLAEAPEVDFTQLDLQWVRRLNAILSLAERGVLVLAGLLGLAVLLVVGNTIRLEVERRREEIVVTRLVGATDAFVRRPFLYMGVWFGLLGGVLAWFLVAVTLGLLAGPIGVLAQLYASDLRLAGPTAPFVSMLLGGAAGLGLLGARLALIRHLRDTDLR